MFALLAIFDEQERYKFDSLYKLYFEPLCRYAFKIVASQHIAEEIVQDCFLRILENLQNIQEVDCSKTRNYLFIIVKNLAINVYNRNRHFVIVEGEEEDAPTDFDPTWSAYELEHDREVLQSLINELPQEDYMLLLLKVKNGYSYKNIAALMGITEKNVSVRLTRIRSRLAKKFRSKGVHSG